METGHATTTKYTCDWHLVSCCRYLVPEIPVTLYVNGYQDTQNATSIPSSLGNSFNCFEYRIEEYLVRLTSLPGWTDEAKFSFVGRLPVR